METVDEAMFVLGTPFFLQISPFPAGRSMRFVVPAEFPLTPAVLFSHIKKYFPHRDLTKPVRWKDMEGDLISVPSHNLNNWKTAIIVTRDMVNALDGPGRVTLEVFVNVLQSSTVRYIYEVPTLEELAANAVAKLVPNKGAVDKLPIPVMLKALTEKEVEFLDNCGSKTARKHVTAVLNN